MKTSNKGIELMHLFEGYKTSPYLCSANMWTIGWGHVLYQDQIKLPLIRKNGYDGKLRHEYKLKEDDNKVWVKSELEEIFKNDLIRFESGVLRLAPNLVSHQSKFDACVSFSYNLGLGNFQASTLRQKIIRNEWDAAANEFLRWNKVGGKVLLGLTRRRIAEQKLFLQ